MPNDRHGMEERRVLQAKLLKAICEFAEYIASILNYERYRTGEPFSPAFVKSAPTASSPSA
ncbi:MAG: hypothetical protein LC808_30030 [Actinobacteria bacterium]|nr:hypothetical protein [Actinomycetota bacterium]